MKKLMLMMSSPVLLLGIVWGTAPSKEFPAAAALPATTAPAPAPEITGSESGSGQTGREEELITYAMSLLGSPYVYAGISPDGFDCSGFVTHVFSNYGIKVPHSSAMQANEGVPVPRQEARPGDIVIFRGTNPNVRKPGHTGIVISPPGDTISFVHSSSNGGVKVSQVEGTGYNKRFLEVRRVL